MAFPKKMPDLLSAKARALNDEIAALEAEIKKLDTQLQRPVEPRFSNAYPPSVAVVSSPAEKVLPAPVAPEPVFEDLNHAQLAPRAEVPELFNELGVRKYDLPGLLHRLQQHFRGPATSNPRLVNYLAAGGVHGLRPLRYERRIARRRFIWLVAALCILLFGMFYVLMPRH